MRLSVKKKKNIKNIKIIMFACFSLFLFYKNLLFLKRPKISIIIPIYNKENYLNRSFGSIFNQTLKGIEIIAVNDASTDNSIKNINDFKKNDSRIKIVNNDKNRGVFYSRLMGIINSIGEYIMFLEPDDLFEGKDNLEYLYNQYKNTKEDIITFKYYHVQQKRKKTKCEKYNVSLRQPEVFKIAFNNHRVKDEIIWNKLIKRKLYFKIYKLLEKFLMKERWIHHDDYVFSLLSHKHAKSMRCIDKLAYIYEKNNASITSSTGTVLELKNLLNRHEVYEILFDETTEEYFFRSIKDLINIINGNQFWLNLVKTDEEIKFRTIKIMSDFINRYENKKLNIKKIASFLNSIT